MSNMLERGITKIQKKALLILWESVFIQTFYQALTTYQATS